MSVVEAVAEEEVDVAKALIKLANMQLRELGLSCEQMVEWGLCPRWGNGDIYYPCPSYWLCALAEKILTDLSIADLERFFAWMLEEPIQAKYITPPPDQEYLKLTHECLNER